MDRGEVVSDFSVPVRGGGGGTLPPTDESGRSAGQPAARRYERRRTTRAHTHTTRASARHQVSVARQSPNRHVARWSW